MTYKVYTLKSSVSALKEEDKNVPVAVYEEFQGIIKPNLNIFSKLG